MGRRTFSPEFELEAVKLVRERGIKISQAAQDLGLHENVLREWCRIRRRTVSARFRVVASSDRMTPKSRGSGASPRNKWRRN